MITPVIKVFNQFSQTEYDDFIDTFLSSIHLVICPNNQCNSVGNFVIHAYYFRNYGLGIQPFKLEVLRVRCKDCNTTHAVLPICIIAYCPFPADICCEIIYMRLQENKSYYSIGSVFNIDKRIAKRLINRFVDEHQDDHLRIFGSLNHLKSITVDNLERYFIKTKLLCLVSKNKLKQIHYSLIPYSLIPYP